VTEIGEVGDDVKLAAGLFWADYAVLGEQIRELESAGVDWLHIEVRDGRYMEFGMPRGGFDILEAARASTSLPIEAQLQMYRPSFDVFRQLKDLGVDLISLPLETMQELTMQAITFIKDALGLKVGVWAWQGTPIHDFEQYIIDYVDIVEYESRAHFWATETGSSPHTMDRIMLENIHRLHDMIVEAGLEASMDLMEDGGLNPTNVSRFVEVGMTVGEFSSPLLKGSGGKLPPNTGQITKAVHDLRAVLIEASAKYRAGGRLIQTGSQPLGD